MMHNLRKMLVLLSLFAWVPAHAGFLDKLFGSSSESSPVALPQNPAVYDTFVPTHIAGNVSDYRLGAGDKLGITVFNEKELSMELRLSDAGSFLYPFLGEVIVKNKTIGDLQVILTQRLKDGYLVDPKVYVTILEYRPFFVNGEVGKPGGYPYQPGLTIRKAISLAGGLTPRASLAKIYVVHESDPTGTPRLTTLNAVLQAGDTITIDQSFF
jgi:protein involved in polysaccharide export with SLBB domain